MPNWPTEVLCDISQVFDVLVRLKGRMWQSRGQPKANPLLPSIDRGNLKTLSRAQKLRLERESIDVFRSTVRYWGPGEESPPAADVRALMVMRHYGVKTRLLDWSESPHVATYFAVEKHDTADGELWTFDRFAYETEGAKQWDRWPQTRWNGCFLAEKTMSLEDPPKWFVCQYYPQGFPRQDAQQGLYSMTADFGRDHADAIEELLRNWAEPAFRKYIIKASLKESLRRALREQHGIWRGSLFPDSSGAADTAGMIFPRMIDGVQSIAEADCDQHGISGARSDSAYYSRGGLALR